ncbi:MAG: archease [Candidatus Micrarchaeota archaeon]
MLRYLEHKADVLFEASGASFEKTLEEAAEGLFETIADVRKIKATKKVTVKQTAKKLDELLVFTLSDLLTQSDVHELFFAKFKIKKFGKKGDLFFIEGVAEGTAMTPKLGRTSVKAVTLHESRVIEKDGKWTARVLLDV